jgi:hypothetical protein
MISLPRGPGPPLWVSTVKKIPGVGDLKVSTFSGHAHPQMTRPSHDSTANISHRLIGKTRRNEDTLSVDISTSSSWEIAGHNEDKPSDQRLWPLSPIATIQKLQEFLR